MTHQARSAPIALNVAAPTIVELHDAVLSDLDTTKFGVGWWARHPGASRRILISDYLSQCLMSVQKNLTEAAVHYLFMADSLVPSPHGLLISPPPARSAQDDLRFEMVELHIAAFFRALVGGLDCLGAAVVGVAALPIAILTADLKRARRAFQDIKGTVDGARLQVRTGEQLAALLDTAGPAEWLDWTYDIRNMLVHRGRRLHGVLIRPREPRILAASGKRVLRGETIHQLPSDPDRSEIEILLSDHAPVLPEAASSTLKGLLETVVRVANETGALLSEVWTTRRSKPEMLAQPAKQWPTGPSAVSTDFEGSRPGTVRYDPAAFTSHTSTGRRLLAAALDDPHRPLWATFVARSSLNICSHPTKHFAHLGSCRI